MDNAKLLWFLIGADPLNYVDAGYADLDQLISEYSYVLSQVTDTDSLAGVMLGLTNHEPTYDKIMSVVQRIKSYV